MELQYIIQTLSPNSIFKYFSHLHTILRAKRLKRQIQTQVHRVTASNQTQHRTAPKNFKFITRCCSCCLSQPKSLCVCLKQEEEYGFVLVLLVLLVLLLLNIFLRSLLCSDQWYPSRRVEHTSINEVGIMELFLR